MKHVDTLRGHNAELFVLNLTVCLCLYIYIYIYIYIYKVTGFHIVNAHYIYEIKQERECSFGCRQ